MPKSKPLDGVEELFQIDKKGDRKTAAKTGKRKKGKKPISRKPVEDEQEEALEEFLFGAKDAAVLSDDDEAGEDGRHRDEEMQEEAAEEKERERRAEAGEPAWIDEDDEQIIVDISGKDIRRKLRVAEEEKKVSGKEYSERLRKQMGRLTKEVSWATRKRHKKQADAGDDLLRTSAKFLGIKSGVLPSSELLVERMKDVNIQDVSDAVIQSCRFHPSNNLMLTAGLDKRLKIFQVDGKHNPKVQGVFFEDLPIMTAEFTPSGEEIFVSGRRKHFYVYDLGGAQMTKVQGIQGRPETSLSKMFLSPDNKHLAFLGVGGNIALVSRQTKQWVADLRMNQDVECAAFSADGHSLYSAGKGGLIYHWDLRMRRCLRKIVDEGSLSTSALAMSANGSCLAAGSHSGVVNLYDTEQFEGLSAGSAGEIRPAARKALMNLHTRVSLLRFNADTQLLLMASQAKQEAFRVVHVGKGGVFANWPTAGTPLHHVHTADISPSSSALAIGNDRGKVLLYRLKHYS